MAKFYYPVVGGIESVVFELTEGLNRLGQKTDVLCANTSIMTQREMYSSGYRVTRAGSLGSLLSTSLSPALVMETLTQRRRYDVIHIHLPNPMANLALQLVRPSCKIIVHWHSDIVNQKKALILYEPMQKWLLNRADAIISTSPPYAESSPWLRGFMDKVTIIPIGIPRPKAKQKGKSAKDIRKQFGYKRIIFSLGRMIYYKGFDVLIEAVRFLPDDCVVLVGGTGPLLNQYRRKIVQNGLADRVMFVGKISHEDIYGYFEASSIFCLPSTERSEAFGVVLLEAMSMSKPIVATNIPGSGVPWVNADSISGINVPPNDPVALAEALIRIIQNEELALALGTGGNNRYRKYFTADMMVQRTYDLYKSLL